MKINKVTVLVGIIIILVLVLLTMSVGVPQYNKLIEQKQIEAAQSVVFSIINLVDQQGYIVLSNTENSIVLTRNLELEQQLAESQQQ